MAAPRDAQTNRGPASSEQGLSGSALAFRRAEPYMAASSTLMGSVGLCTAIGYALDRWLHHTVMWMLVAGAVIGIVVGFVGFFAQVLRADAHRSKGHATGARGG